MIKTAKSQAQTTGGREIIVFDGKRTIRGFRSSNCSFTGFWLERRLTRKQRNLLSVIMENIIIMTIMNKVLPFLLAITIGFSAAFSARAQNALTNGDFEAPPYAPSFTVTGWTVSGNGNIHEIAEGATSPTHSAAFNVGGDSQGNILSQTFSTINGQVYTLDFDTGIFGVPVLGSTLLLNAMIQGNATLLNETVLPPIANTFDVNSIIFHHHHFTFTADSNTTTLQFSDIGTGNPSADTVLDTVIVVPNHNILVNGDFETAPFNTIGTVSGWSVAGNSTVADRSDQGTAGGTHAAAFNVGGDSEDNTLEQSFSTVSGQEYTLDFYAGIFGVPSSTLQLHVQVYGPAVTLLDQTVTPPSSNTSLPNLVMFQHYHFTFTAASNTTTLQFSDVGTGNSAADTMLDTVSVVSLAPAPTPTPTPTPTSIPRVSVLASPTTVNEGGTAPFTVSASPVNPSQPITVFYSMSGKAVLGVDYTLSGTPGQVVIPAGQSSATITLTALKDSISKKKAIVKMTLDNGAGYKASCPPEIVTIVSMP
jgi:hypothetical protein